MLKEIAKAIVPASWRSRFRAAQRQREIKRRPVLSRQDLLRNLDRMQIARGDTIFLHSGFSNLNLQLSIKEVAEILLERLGPDGTLLLPTFPPLPALEWMLAPDKFDVRRTPCLTGLLPEYVRRLPNAIRSLHPSKAVVAIGPRAKELVSDHAKSELPFDAHSPFYKLIAAHAKVAGLGVPTNYLTFVHAIEDDLREKFPVEPYDERRLTKTCVDATGQEHQLSCYCHRPCVTNYSDLPGFFRRHVSEPAVLQYRDRRIDFFVADAGRLFDEMKQLALRRITIYPADFLTRYPRTGPLPSGSTWTT